MSIQIKEFAFVYHQTTDIPASQKFYEQVLGLKSSLKVELAPGKWWIEYDVAGQALAVSNFMPSDPSTSLALEVVDFDAAVKTVREKGVPIVNGPIETPGCHMVEIRDPSGNEITLHKSKAR